MIKRVEHKCSECRFWKTGYCPNGQGVVVWKNCRKFKAPLGDKEEFLHEYKKKQASEMWRKYFGG